MASSTAGYGQRTNSLSINGPALAQPTVGVNGSKPKQRSRRKNAATEEEDDAAKRRCVSTACIACRKRKSKCDGNTPKCAACSQVYGTECIYDPNSDHRRKGVYKTDGDSLKTRDSTLHTLIHAILNYPEDDVPALVREIRTCESLDLVAERINAREEGIDPDEDDEDASPGFDVKAEPTFESNLGGKMGDLRVDDGSLRYIGGTSNLIHLASEETLVPFAENVAPPQEDAVTSWTTVTNDPDLITHLLQMYFTWHYTYFTTLSKDLFYRDFYLGKPPDTVRRGSYYCTPLLVNAMLALGCHFTSNPGARDFAEDQATAGDHFFREAKRLLMENDEHEKPHITTVQALALMSVREAGCAREARGWIYSGMAFRMLCDQGLNLDSSHLGDDREEDARRVTFWGCYLFDKCWSNYMGRLPQIPTSIITVPKYEVFPDGEAETWTPYTDSGPSPAHTQPSRTRTVALQIIKLCEISNDLMKYFYNPTDMEKTKGKAAELRKLSDIHTRLEAWRRELPKELEPREGCLAAVLVCHMFFQLLFIHAFRPFLKYTQATSPLPPNVSPRKLCTQAAAMISKLMRLYKRSFGLRQICNIAVYICHSSSTIHLLNLPDKNAKRDIVHGVKHLQEMEASWLGAGRSLGILGTLAAKWNVDLPEEAATVLAKHAQRRPSVQYTPSQADPTQTWQHFPPTLLQGAPGYINHAVAAATTATTKGGIPTNGAAPLRSPPSTYMLPPQDANGLRAQQYPSAHTTPQHPPYTRQPSDTTTSKSSPSELFGGIEQLIRDSSDWAYRDQQQLAHGFENWNTLELDPSAWANGGSGGAGAGAGGGGGGGGMEVPLMAGGGAVQPNVSMAPLSSHAGAGGTHAHGPAVDLSNMNAWSLYDESEWYQ